MGQKNLINNFFLIISLSLLFFGEKASGQTVENQIRFMTYQDFNSDFARENLITCAAKIFFNPSFHFLNGGNGRFYNASPSEFLAVVDPTLGKVVVKPDLENQRFIIARDANLFGRPIRIQYYFQFLGWDGEYYRLDFSQFLRLRQN